MSLPSNEPRTADKPTSFTWLKILGIVVFTSIISTLVAVLMIKTYLFQDEFRPVNLNAREEQALETKLERLDPAHRPQVPRNNSTAAIENNKLAPEPYAEADANRQVILTERELNALLAQNTDLASRLAIDLSENLASAKLLLPLDQEFPILGGQTLKVTAGLELSYADGRPIVILRGVSLWGLPLPNAWLGNMKNIDLVREFGTEPGFWQAFADGIDEIEVAEETLRIRLKE